jgi:hypothetical protein
LGHASLFYPMFGNFLLRTPAPVVIRRVLLGMRRDNASEALADRRKLDWMIDAEHVGMRPVDQAGARFIDWWREELGSGERKDAQDTRAIRLSHL